MEGIASYLLLRYVLLYNNDPQQLQETQQQQQPHHKQREGVLGFLWKLSRIGERLSPYIGAACVLQAINVLFFK